MSTRKIGYVKDIVGPIDIVSAGFANRHRADWNQRVYHQPDNGFDMSQEEWRLLRYAAIQRDKRRCKRCDKRFKIIDLSAHHIMPRDDGGSNDMSNLVTLCHPCHDYVEINKLKTLSDIMGSYEDGKKDRSEDHEPVEQYIPEKWQEWVYGGFRNPRL